MTKEKPVKSLSADEVFDLDERGHLAPFPVEIKGKTYLVKELDACTMADISRSCIRESGERDEKEFRARVIQAGCVSPAFGLQHLERIKTLSNTLHTGLFISIVNGKKKGD